MHISVFNLIPFLFINKHSIILMNRFLFLIIFSLATLGVSAQQRAVYVEVNGASNGFSANYDSRLAPNSHWGYDVGLGHSIDTYGSSYRYGLSHVSMPLRMYYLTGKRAHHFEIGAGVVPGFLRYTERISRIDEEKQYHIESKRKQFCYYLTLNMGYRYQMTRGLVLRTGLCINAHDRENTDNVLQPYVAIGYSF